jgi:hypothetical protein
VFFLVGANTTFDVSEMFRKTVAVPTCQYGLTLAPDPTFTYQLLNMDGTALDSEISSGIDITKYGGFLFTLSNFEPENVVSVRIHGRLHDSQQTYGIVHLHP